MRLTLKIDERGHFYQLVTPTGEVVEGILDITLAVGGSEMNNYDKSLYVTVKFQVDFGEINLADALTAESMRTLMDKRRLRCGADHD